MFIFLKIILSVIIGFTMIIVIGIWFLTPGYNDCIYRYVNKSMNTGVWKGVSFQYPDGRRHVAHISDDWQRLAPHFVGTANGCLINSGGAISSVFNSYYCVVMTWVVSTGLKSGFLK